MKIVCPDFITVGHYSINDIMEYFEAIQEKWRVKKLDEIENKITGTISNMRLAYQSMLDESLPISVKKSIENAINKMIELEKEIKNKK